MPKADDAAESSIQREAVSPEKGNARASGKKASAKKRKRKRSGMLSSVITTLGVIVGLLLLAYPWVADWYANYLALERIDSFSASVEFMSEDEKNLMFDEAIAYNHLIAGDASDYAVHPDYPLDYEEMLDYTPNGVMATIEVPKVGIKQPVFHGTDESTLMSGAGHMEGTSLPIGGENTHAMISGHTGMPGQRMFDGLRRVDKGDIVKVTVLDRNFYYEVAYLHVVDPTYSDFGIRQGESLLTLVTCTPYGINDHRLLVECHQIDYTEEQFEDLTKQDDIENYLNLRTIPFIIATIVVGAFFIGWVAQKRSRKKKGENTKGEKTIATMDESASKSWSSRENASASECKE